MMMEKDEEQESVQEEPSKQHIEADEVAGSSAADPVEEAEALAETEQPGAPPTEKEHKRHGRRKRPPQRLVNEDEYVHLQEKSKKADEYYDHYVRARAELDNLRKRAQRDREEFVRYANERLLSEIIPVIENFERAFTAAEKVPETHNFALGVELILKQLRETLGRYGVSELYPKGEPFDPAKHEAADTVETTEHPDHTVVEVLHRGYMLNGRVVQPAVVRVAVNPQPAAQQAEAEGVEISQAEDEETQS